MSKIVVCNNCGAQFDDSEPKCPYCGMIYEPGAEAEYHEKLEDIRENLDMVDDLVVTNLKTDLLHFLKVFLITCAIVLAFSGLIYRSRQKTERKIKDSVISEYEDWLERIIEFDKISKDWNALYESGQYEEMYRAAQELRKQYGQDFTYWRHYDFYTAYSEYSIANDYISDIVERGEFYTIEFSRILYCTLNLYCDIEKNLYGDLSVKDKEVLMGLYEQTKGDIIDVFSISLEEYEEMKNRLVGEKTTFVGSTECEALAKERFGE